MNKFWEWMVEKGYAQYYERGYVIKGKGISAGYVKPTKQMLIGYKHEYIIENKIKRKYDCPFPDFDNIENMYNYLEHLINK